VLELIRRKDADLDNNLQNVMGPPRVVALPDINQGNTVRNASILCQQSQRSKLKDGEDK
jgi:hypothetical protein